MISVAEGNKETTRKGNCLGPAISRFSLMTEPDLKTRKYDRQLRSENEAILTG
jgi:hypothetical protein